MSELIEEIYPPRTFHMSEVMTVNSIQKVNELEPLAHPELAKSIGKLFIVSEDDSVLEATVFVIFPGSFPTLSFPADRILCLTDLHNVVAVFQKPKSLFVSFHHVCKPERIARALCHLPADCPQNLFKANPSQSFPSTQDPSDFDPVTGEPYSIRTDIEILSVDLECSCGRSVNPPDIVPLPIGQLIDGLDLLLVGYPGSYIPQRRAMPYASINPGISFMTKGNVLKQSTGQVLDKNERLMAITNSSVTGMSGSPIFQDQGSGLVVVSILLGGPAVKNHFKFLRMSQHVLQNDFPQALALLNEVSSDSPTFCDPFDLGVLNYCLSVSDQKNSMMYISKIYFELIKKKSETLTREESLAQLSHNVGFRIESLI